MGDVWVPCVTIENDFEIFSRIKVKNVATKKCGPTNEPEVIILDNELEVSEMSNAVNDSDESGALNLKNHENQEKEMRMPNEVTQDLNVENEEKNAEILGDNSFEPILDVPDENDNNLCFIKRNEVAKNHLPKNDIFICDNCGREFNQKLYLKFHVLAHFRERLYKCNKCDKSYVHLGSLKRHLTIHSKKKILVSGKTRNWKYSLRSSSRPTGHKKSVCCKICDVRDGTSYVKKRLRQVTSRCCD